MSRSNDAKSKEYESNPKAVGFKTYIIYSKFKFRSVLLTLFLWIKTR